MNCWSMELRLGSGTGDPPVGVVVFDSLEFTAKMEVSLYPSRVRTSVLAR